MNNGQHRDNDTPMVLARVMHRVGGGIKWVYNRNLAMSLGISIGIHLLAIGLYAMLREPQPDRNATPIRLATLASPMLDTHMVMIDMSDVHVVEGGAGGSPESKEPVGKALKGDPHATPKVVPDKKPKIDPTRTFEPKVTKKIKVVDREPKPKAAVATTDRDTAKGPSSGHGTPGQHADGTGAKTTGGSGGAGIGHGVGIGIGDGKGLGSRGWLRRPSSKTAGDVNTFGVVKLKFKVLPNGDIVNIRPVKKLDPTLTNLAISRLSNAKYKSLPAGVPQVPVESEIPITFSPD